MLNINALNIQDLEISQRKLELIIQYVELVDKFNKAVQLTSLTNLNTFLINHIEDSCRAYHEIKVYDPELFYDFGSGNGLPAVIFAILSDLEVTAFDKDERKLEFQKFVAHRLKIPLKTQIADLKSSDFDVPRGTIITYRGLGPESLLLELEKKYSEAIHMRFISSHQENIWIQSRKIEYLLSDGSKRGLEITT